MNQAAGNRVTEIVQRRLGRSHALICQGSFRQAREILHSILAEGDEHGTVFMLLGYCALAEEKYEDAIKWYGRGLEKEPGNSALQVLLGEALLMGRKEQEAKEILIQIIKRDEGSINAKLARALIEAEHLGVFTIRSGGKR
jgi:predicted Zn-dependent protease